MSTVEEIKSRLGILELIESYIKIEKAGTSFRARCPFHNEKTPSFYISPDRGSYYCFGCGAKGDIFSFVQEFEGLDFVGALKMLADKAGVTITYDKSENYSEKDILFKILEKTTTYLEQNLNSNVSVKSYLQSRGLSEESIKKWRLGYVPDGWRNILDFLVKSGFSLSDIEKAGLIKKNDRGDYYDRFRDRIMFPIFDPSSRVIGYSGRTMKKDTDEAKYLNSPETVLFDKSNILFGYNFAKQSIRKNNFSILVEGQFDVLMSHQAGYSNTVATSGTALSESQVDLLRRLSDRLVIAMDGDGAGFRASQKAWELALQKGIDVKMAYMDSKEDPADVIKDNPERWKDIIKNSIHIIDFIIAKIKSTEYKDSRAIMKAVSEKVLPYLALIPGKLEQSYFIKSISNKFSIAEEVIWQEVDSYDSEVVSEKENETVDDPLKSDRFAVLKQIVGIILWQEKSSVPSIDTQVIRKKVEDLVGEKNFSKIFQTSNIDEIVFQVERLYCTEESISKLMDELLENLRKKVLEYRRQLLKTELKKAEDMGDSEKEKELLQKIIDISKDLGGIMTKFYK